MGIQWSAYTTHLELDGNKLRGWPPCRLQRRRRFISCWSFFCLFVSDTCMGDNHVRQDSILREILLSDPAAGTSSHYTMIWWLMRKRCAAVLPAFKMGDSDEAVSSGELQSRCVTVNVCQTEIPSCEEISILYVLTHLNGQNYFSSFDWCNTCACGALNTVCYIALTPMGLMSPVA